MKLDDFRQKYHQLADNRIADFGNMCEHPYFDKLLAVMNSSYGYRLFNPLSGDFGKDGVDFDTYCRKVWPNVTHAVEDDGDICFLHVVLEWVYPYYESGTTFAWKNGQFFVMNGSADELAEESIFKTATFHSPENGRMISYSGIRFNWDFVDFLYGMIPEFEAEKLVGEGTSPGESVKIKKYRDMERAIEKKFEEYIASKTPYTKHFHSVYQPIPV